MPRVGVCLAGCGFKDGAEIHEATFTLLALDQEGAEIVCMAPDTPQVRVVDHVTGKEMKETRNVLVEAARIARGHIRDVAQVKASDLDALIIPGGFGAAVNLCDFAARGANAGVHPEVKRLIVEMVDQGKPIGAICIAPGLLACALKGHVSGAELTIGNDRGTAEQLEKAGARHVDCPVDDCHVDARHKIVTTPAYMLGPGPKDVFKGIKKLVEKVVSMIPVRV